MASRFALFTDACVSGHLIEALIRHGWDVVRAIDLYAEKTPDPVIFAQAAAQDRVFVTNDDGILKTSAAWLREGRPFRMIFWPQAGYQRWTIGELLQAFDELAEEEDPFAYPIRRLKPKQ